MTLAARRAAGGDQFDRLPDDAFGQLPRVADGRGAAQKPRPHAVERGQPAQTPQHVGEVGTEDAAIGVQFVDHHEAQPAKEPFPLRMVRQHRGMQHVRVGNDQPRAGADRAASGRGRVAVVGGHRQRQPRFPYQAVQLVALILGQRLGREQVQGAGVRVFDALLQDRQVVGQRLARGGGRDQHHVAAGTGQLEAALLMGVPRGDAAPL